MADGTHDYTSTACLHDLCEACRRTCKFCDSPCQCAREDCTHSTAGPLPGAWVDQARGIARELLAEHLRPRNGEPSIPPELLRRITGDPDLFWLRGEEAPRGRMPDA